MLSGYADSFGIKSPSNTPTDGIHGTNSINVPPLPYSPNGTVKQNGHNAPLDAVVTAKCDGMIVATTNIQVVGDQTGYGVNIQGDDPDTPGKEGCYSGETVEFFIDDVQADQTGTWTEGFSPRIDLTYTTLEYVYVPLVIR